MAKRIVGIDLGTSHTVVAWASRDEPVPRIFAVPQRVARTEIEARPLFPSCAFATTDGELVGADLPGEETGWVLGAWAKRRGVEVPRRFVASAKSWLCHPSIDKTAAVLPWGTDEEGEEALPRLSPVEASRRYLAHVRFAWDEAHPESPLAEQDVVLTVPASFDEVARELTVRAAREAGLRVRLLEEPQAAFYAAMQRGAIPEGLTSTNALVCDVGGGTTDLSLLSIEGRGEGRRVKRVAVGNHLLLGGDNMDLALAHALEPRLAAPPERLDPRRFAELVIAARDAKERMLGADPPDELTVSVLGRGSQLLGGARSAKLRRDEVEAIVLDGFLPRVRRDDKPARGRSGLVAFGLPFERDPAITKHVAAFVSRHLPSGASVGALLLNGGLFRAARAAERVRETVSAWQDEPPILLDHDDPDLSVALGAVVYGLSLAGVGPRIEGGSARAYFVGLDRDASGARRAVCVLPKGAEEGAPTRTSGRAFSLVVGRPARFDLFSTDDEITARPGDLVDVDADDERFTALPPLVATLTAEGGGRREELSVEIEAELSAVGTIDLACVERKDTSPRRFVLAFDLRGGDAHGTDAATRASTRPARPRGRALEDAAREIDRVFGKSTTSEARDAKGLSRDLEKQLGDRAAWTTETARALADALLATARGRRRSPEHERAYFLLLGYCLRPGFGSPGDEQRIARMVPLFAERLAFPKEARGWQQFFIAWRRVAGGLVEATQVRIRDELDPFLAPPEAKLKKPKGAKPESLDDLTDLASHLERVPSSRRAELGAWLLERTWTDRDPRIWAALGRLGARVPAYASAHHAVSITTAERWIDHLLREKWGDLPTAPRAAADLARCTQDRARDVSESVRAEVARRLEREGADARLVKMVRELVPIEDADRTAFFGDSLPIGLSLAD